MDVQLIKELHAEAERQGRALSWLMQRAWKMARRDIQRYRLERPPQP